MITILNILVEKFGLFYSILFFSGLFLVNALLCYYHGKRKLSYFFLYLSLTYSYFFILLTLNTSPILVTYGYYFLIFISYHYYFSFTRVFYLRTIVIIKKYLNNSEYVKLILWVFLVFVCSLFGDKFIFLMVFNPLLLFSVATSNFIFVLFLIIIWSWMFVLIFCNKLGVCNKFLLSIQNYFSRKACLHFIGNSPGKVLCQKVGTIIVCTPIVISVPATAGYILDKEADTGNYAISQMEAHKIRNPNCSDTEQYSIYNKSYIAHANSSIVGRQLSKWGVMQPAAPEAVIPNYSTGMQKSIDSLNNNNK